VNPSTDARGEGTRRSNILLVDCCLSRRPRSAYKQAQALAAQREDATFELAMSDPCAPVEIKRSKTNMFTLASEHVAHASMGASAVLDGCPCKEDHDDAALFIIDPQNDFHEGGSLGVPGATDDSKRIAALIRNHADKLDHIVVSLDAHHPNHIAHAAFWTNEKGEKPAAFTEIKHADVVAGTWKSRLPDLQEWAVEYTKSLEGGGRFTHIIWPDHCLLGTPGHCVSPALMPALLEWSERRQRSVTWVLKGQNNRTEMYSALKAEVPVVDDPGTTLNETLIDTLISHRQVLICGEAKSHCVNFTTRDLLTKWPKERASDLVLLTDATSPVPGFEKSAEQFEADMRSAGLTLVSTTEFVPK